MPKFLQSGRRRDMCALLAGDPQQAQALKSKLESLYDERVEPKSFYGALEKLEKQGFVTTETQGIHDVYRLTDSGRERLLAHVDWLTGQTDSVGD